MKFLCPNCKAKYQISDEKISGRTLKMDCRRCNHPIVIRGDRRSAPPPRRRASSPSVNSSVDAQRKRTSHVGPAPSRSSRSALGADFRKGSGGAVPPPPSRPPTALDQWHVAINDVPVGPMKRDEVSRKIASGAITAKSLSWREGLDDWRELKDIPELAELLRRNQAAKRPPVPPKAGFPPPGRSISGRAPRARAPTGRGALPSSRPADPDRAAARAARGRIPTGGNVVPIGGRMGAGAAPALDEMPAVDDFADDEPTRVGTAIDFEKMEADARAAEARDVETSRRAVEAREAETTAREAERARAEQLAALTSTPGPLSEPPAPAAPVGLGGHGAESDAFDPFSQPGALPPTEPLDVGASASGPGMYAAPGDAPIPVAAPPAERRRRAIPIGVWIAIAGAVSFGIALAVMVGSQLVVQPPVVETVVAPADPVVRDRPDDLVLDVLEEPEPPPEDVVEDRPETAEDPEPATNRPRTPRTGAPRTPRRPTENLTAAQRRMLENAAEDEPGAAPQLDGVGNRPSVLDDRQRQGPQELTQEQIVRVVNRERGQVQRCYESETRQSGRAPGLRVDVAIVIGPSGTVTSASARSQTSFGNLNTCIERYVRRWRFARSAGQTRTSIPFVFSGRD